MPRHHQRRARDKQERRFRILDAARELFLEGGEAALTLRAVAERIEYSPTTIYQHFAGKEALVRELCTADASLLAQRLRQAERISHPLERLRRMCLGYVDFGLRHPHHYRVMYLTGSGRDPTPEEILPPGTGPDQLSLNRVAFEGDPPSFPVTRPPRDFGQDTDSTAVPEPSEAADTPRRAKRKVIRPVAAPPTTGAGEPDPASVIPVGGAVVYPVLHAAVLRAIAAGLFRAEWHDAHLAAQVLWSSLHGLVSLALARTTYPGIGWRTPGMLADATIDCLLTGFVDPSAARPDWG